MKYAAVTSALLCVWLVPACAADNAPTTPPPEGCGYFSINPDDSDGPPVLFYTDMSADEESAVTESPGQGHAEFILDRKTLRLSWTLTYQNLSTPVIAIGLYGPQTPGNEGGLLYSLTEQREGNKVTGSVVLKDADVTYIVHDRFYVNITTKKYPNGEIRGPVKKRPAKC